MIVVEYVLILGVVAPNFKLCGLSQENKWRLEIVYEFVAPLVSQILIGYLSSFLVQLKDECLSHCKKQEDIENERHKLISDLVGLPSQVKSGWLGKLKISVEQVITTFEVPSPQCEWMEALYDDVFLDKIETVFKIINIEKRKDGFNKLKEYLLNISKSSDEYKSDLMVSHFLSSLEKYVYINPETSLPLIHHKIDGVYNEISDIGEQLSSFFHKKEQLEVVFKKLTEKAKKCIDLHEYKEATFVLSELRGTLSSSIPDNIKGKVYLLSGILHSELNEFNDSLQYLKMARDLDDSPEARGRYYFTKLQMESDLDLYANEIKKAIEKYPDEPQLVGLYIKCIDSDKIDSYVNSLSQSVQGDAIFKLNLVFAYMNCKRYTDAILTIESCSECLDTDSFAIWKNYFRLCLLVEDIYNKDLKYLKPEEKDELENTSKELMGYVKGYPKSYNRFILLGAIRLLSLCLGFFEDKDPVEKCLIQTASFMDENETWLYASEVLLRRGEIMAALSLFEKIDYKYFVENSEFYFIALGLYSQRKDMKSINCVYNQLKGTVLNTLITSTVKRSKGCSEYPLLLIHLMFEFCNVMGENDDKNILCSVLDGMGDEIILPLEIICIINRVSLKKEPADISDAIIQDLVSKGDWFTVRNIISLWIHDKEYTQIVKIAGLFFDSSVFSNHLDMCIWAGFENCEEAFLYEVLGSLFEAGYRNSDVVFSYLELLYMQEPNKAKRMARDIHSENIGCLFSNLILCQWGIWEEDSELVKLPNPVPQQWDLFERNYLYIIVSGLILSDRSLEALDLAFKAYLEIPDNISVQRAIVTLFMPNIIGVKGNNLPVNCNVREVGDGVWVKLVDDLAQTERCLWIVSDHDSHALKNNYDINSPFAKSFIGNKVGDVVEIDAMTSYTIKEIKDWRIAVFRMVLDDLSSRNDHPRFIWPVSVESKNPKEKYDFTRLFSVLDNKKKEDCSKIELLKNHHFPVSFYAKALSQDYPSAWLEVVQRRDVQRSMLESLKFERKSCEDWMSSGGVIVMDESALLISFLFETDKFLSEYSYLLRIPSFLRSKFKGWIRNISLYTSYCRYRDLVHPKELVADKWKSFNVRLEEFQVFLSGVNDIEGPLSKTTRGKISEDFEFAFSRSTRQIVAVCDRYGCPILCDDFGTKSLLNEMFNIRGFSQATLLAAINNGEGTVDFFAKSIILKYGGIPITSSIACRLYELLGWDVESGNDDFLLKGFRDWQRKDKNALFTIAEMFETFHVRCGVPEISKRLIWKFLNQVFPKLQDFEKVWTILDILRIRSKKTIVPFHVKRTIENVLEWLEEVRN